METLGVERKAKDKVRDDLMTFSGGGISSVINTD